MTTDTDPDAPPSTPKPSAEKRRLYADRRKLKRWKEVELPKYAVELAMKEAHVAEHGVWTGPGSLEYPRSKVAELRAKIAELERRDLRTEYEKKTGKSRKAYSMSAMNRARLEDNMTQLTLDEYRRWRRNALRQRRRSRARIEAMDMESSRAALAEGMERDGLLAALMVADVGCSAYDITVALETKAAAREGREPVLPPKPESYAEFITAVEALNAFDHAHTGPVHGDQQHQD